MLSVSLMLVVAMSQMIIIAIGQMNLSVGAIGGLVAISFTGLMEVYSMSILPAVLHWIINWSCLWFYKWIHHC